MSVAKTFQGFNDIISPSVIELEPSKHLKMYIGAMRQEYNNTYFKSKKRKIKAGKSIISTPSLLLSPEDIENIRLNVKSNILHNHYSKSTKKSGTLKIMPLKPRTFFIKDSQITFKNKSFHYKFKMTESEFKRFSSHLNGEYSEGIVTERNGVPVLLYYPSSHVINKTTNFKIKQLVNQKLKPLLANEREQQTIMKIAGVKEFTRGKEQQERMTIKRMKRNQNKLYSILEELHNNYIDYSMDSVREFNKITENQKRCNDNISENQADVLGHTFGLSIRELMVQDFEYIGIRDNTIERILSYACLKRRY
jgi:hypothetical protein